MAKNYKKPQAMQLRQARMDQTAKKLMFAVLLRNATVFEQVHTLITPEHFDAHEVVYRVVWMTLLDYFEKFQGLPTYEFLVAELDERIAADPGVLTSIESETLNEFLEFAFNPGTFTVPVETDEKVARWTVQRVQQYVREHVLLTATQALVTEDSIPLHVPEVLSRLMTQIQVVDSLMQTTDTVAFPDEWDQNAAVEIRPTGIAFFDHFMCGGHAAGEVYGLMGPYGSCKSTLAYMLAVQQAKAAYDRLQQNPGSRRQLSFVVSYEDRLPVMRQRTIGYAATVHRSSMQQMRSYDDLSMQGGLREYELREFRDVIRTMGMENTPGERERVEHSRTILNQHLCLLDMTGFGQAGVGGGGIREIAGMINKKLRDTDAECCCVIVDYVGAMVRRFIAMSDGDPDRLRHYISQAVVEGKSMIADEFDTPIWLLHQLSGAANSRMNATVADHTDAAENRAWAENLDFSFSISRILANDLGVIGCTKHRRAGVEEKRVIRVKGELYRVDDASSTYRVNPDTNRIENPHELSRVADAAELQRARPAGDAVPPPQTGEDEDEGLDDVNY